jgi:hypothetical protein
LVYDKLGKGDPWSLTLRILFAALCDQKKAFDQLANFFSTCRHLAARLQALTQGENKMLFMITSKHDYSTCQANHPENNQHFRDTLSNLGDHGIKVHAMYSNRLQHTAFIVCEADSMEQLDAGFSPILDFGNFEVTPVMERK